MRPHNNQVSRKLVGRIVLLPLLCCLPSCSSNGNSTRANEVTASSRSCPGLPALDNSMLSVDAPDSALQIFLVSAKRFGDTEASLSSCLGTPSEFAVDTVANLHTGEPDNILRITYPGIRYTIYRVLADGKEILFHVEAFAPTEELALGIHVGVPWSHVLEELGPPSDEGLSTDASLVARYVVGTFVEETVTFWVEDGAVNRISWDYYID